MERIGDGATDLVFQREQVARGTLERIPPHWVARRDGSKASGDAQSVSGCLDAALDDMVDAQPLTDLPNFQLCALEVEGRGSPRDPDVVGPAENEHQLLRQTIAEVTKAPVGARVDERNHRNGHSSPGALGRQAPNEGD